MVANEPPDEPGSSTSTTTAAPGTAVVPRPTQRTEAGDHTQLSARTRIPLRSIGTDKAGLRGDLDEVTTWDEALSPEQVRADYAHDDR
ncbi:hypothetical protein [Streptomyces sp. NPDC048411]|uniref:hypothetical protein n=1 Tax=Streptomyces sp. NPDC048411 TaxID=3157206 RepID=UPI003453C6AB